MAVVITIIVLVFVILTLMIYNIIIHKKVEKFNNINQKIIGLNILQDFMNTVGEYSSANEKIQKINEILIERYDMKYSTIVVFDGSEYILKASNVDEKHWDTLKNLHNEEIFKDSISTARPKYVTVEKETERLPYQKMEFGRAKSAMFFPLYIDNVYIGYWIIESGVPHAFDHVDTVILEAVKDNIIAVLKTVEKQNTLESIVRVDKFTGLYSAEYLYGEGKKIIDQYTISTICMFKITNIEQINEELGRKTGDRTIIQTSKVIRDNISNEYIFVRYMGPKFAIIFSGAEPEGVVDFMADVKQKVENLKIEQYVKNKAEPIEDEPKKEKRKKEKEPVFASPKLNFVISTYYKGTGIEEVTKKLEEYLDHAEPNESDINYI